MPDEAAVQDTPAEEQKPKYRKEYQLKDDSGKPIGPPQVFESDDPQEVIDKLAEAHQHASRKIAELRGKIQPDTAQPIPEYKPKSLSADEKWKLTQELTNPDTADSAFDRLFEARVGASPEQVRTTLRKVSETDRKIDERAEAEAFYDYNQDYQPCLQNLENLNKFFEQNPNYARTRKNLELAWEEMKRGGLAVLKSTEQPKEAAKPEAEIAPQTRPRGSTSTALFSQHTSAQQRGWETRKANESFAEEVRKMTQAEYKRRIISDPAFRQKVDNLTQSPR